MSRLITLLSFGVGVAAMPQIAVANSVTLDPGLYDYSHVVMMGGRALPADEYEYCVEEGQNSKTLDELVASLAGDGECTVSNVNMTSSTGRADVACTDTELGMDISGTLEAEYTSSSYDVDTRADIGPIQLLVKTKVRRRGECPVDWDNPDNVSPE
ncbi:MAG: DUF3617 family protein [Litorimonas sp.]